MLDFEELTLAPHSHTHTERERDGGPVRSDCTSEWKKETWRKSGREDWRRRKRWFIKERRRKWEREEDGSCEEEWEWEWEGGREWDEFGGGGSKVVGSEGEACGGGAQGEDVGVDSDGAGVEGNSG